MTVRGKVLCAVAIFCKSLLGQGIAITEPPVVTDRSHSYFTVYWETDVNGTNRIEYGSTPELGSVVQVPRVGSNYGFQFDRRHGLAVTGLAPSTEYYYRTCSANSFRESCHLGANCACSEVRTVTTLPRTQTDPIPPDVSSVAIDEPVPALNAELNLSAEGTGGVISVDAACRTPAGLRLNDALSALRNLTGSETVEIRIDPAAACLGQHVFPARKNHQGWVVVRSSMENRPALFGHRISTDTSGTMPQFRAATLSALHTLFVFIPAACAEGDLYFPFDVKVGFPLFRCGPDGARAQTAKPISSYAEGVFSSTSHGYSSGEVLNIQGTGLAGLDNTIREITVTSPDSFTINGWPPRGTWNGQGTVVRRGSWQRVQSLSGDTLPPTCTEGTWFYKTDRSPNTEAGYLCTSADTWTWYHVRNINNGNVEYATIRIPDGASRYRFVGLNITRQPGLQTPLNSPNTSVRSNFMGALVSVDKGASDIVFDRVLVDGLGYPHRTHFGFGNLDGSRVALINSMVRNIDWWSSTPAVTGVFTEAYAVSIGAGPGPVVIENNHLEATGITFYIHEGSTVGMQPKDILFRRNYVTGSLATMRGRSENVSGMFFSNRHRFELKRGSRIKITENIFTNSWSGASQQNSGEFFMLTPTSASPSSHALHQSELAVTSASDSTVIINTFLGQDWAHSAASGKVMVKITGTDSHNGIWTVAAAEGNRITLKDGPIGFSQAGMLRTITSVAETSDIDISDNVLDGGPSAISGIGFHNWSSGPLPTFVSKRWRFANNKVKNLDFRSTENGGWVAQGYSLSGGSVAKAFAVGLGIEDLAIHNNVIESIQSRSGSTVFYMDPGIDLGMRNGNSVVRNNVFIGSPNVQTIMAAGLYGDDGIAKLFSSSVFIENIFCCGLVTAKVSGNSYVSSIP